MRLPQVFSPHLPGAIVAVGDIHGRADLLEKLLGRIDRRLGDTPRRLVFLGDYVDRGNGSARVIDLLLDIQSTAPDTVFLKGNHEQAMLDFLAAGEEADAWLDWGGDETLRSYGVDSRHVLDAESLQTAFAQALPDEHFSFLMNLRLLYEAGPYVFVHAGLDPDRPLHDQQERDLLWIRDSFMVGGEGRFEGRVVVHGHTPVKNPENLSWRINLDTGACWSGKLSAVILDGEKRAFLST